MPQNLFASTFERCHEISLSALLEDAINFFAGTFKKCHEIFLLALLKDDFYYIIRLFTIHIACHLNST
jgi:hypothetical protein